MNLETTGRVPVRGLVASNHLSYLDVLVLGASAPAVFVAKREVRGWPVIGLLARCAGTVFVLRQRRTKVARSTAEIKSALDQGALVALFPEGTSSGGDILLPFKSALLEPAAQQKHPVFACFIRYELADGSVADEVCYWRDMTLVPHVLKLLGKRGVSAHLSFRQLQNPSANRKELARQLHAEVIRLKEEAVSGSP